MVDATHTTTFHSFCEMCIKLNMETHFGVQARHIDYLEQLYNVGNCKQFKLNKKKKDMFVLEKSKLTAPWCSMFKFDKLRRFFGKLKVKQSLSTCLAQ